MNGFTYGLRRKGKKDLLKCKKTIIKNSKEEIECYILNEKKGKDWILGDIKKVKNMLEKNELDDEINFESPINNYNREQIEIVRVTEFKKLETRFGTKKNTNQMYEKDIKAINYEVEKKHNLKEEKKESLEELLNVELGNELRLECIKDVSKQIGYVRFKDEPNAICFRKGNNYSAFIEGKSLYAINEERVKELICTKVKDKEKIESIFFNKHFKLIEDES